MGLTPEAEAAYALDYGVSRSDLKPDVQAVYDRLLEARKASAARQWAGTLAPSGPAEVPAPDTWQGSPPRPRWQTRWPVWLLVIGPCGVFGAFVVGAFGGSNPNDATNLAAASLFLLALAAVFVAVPGLLYRRHARRVAVRRPPPLPSPFSPCYRCGYPLAVHSGHNLPCPQDGICHRCGQPFTIHTGYELTCPDSAAPHCYRCGQPYEAHVSHGNQPACPPLRPSPETT